jgi:hypothetical protein
MKELEVRMRKLEVGSQLARSGLKSGATGVGLVFVSFAATVGVALYAHLQGGQPFLTGAHIVWLTLIFVVGLVVYFAFVFNRDVQLVGELTKGTLSAQTGTASTPSPTVVSDGEHVTAGGERAGT